MDHVWNENVIKVIDIFSIIETDIVKPFVQNGKYLCSIVSLWLSTPWKKRHWTTGNKVVKDIRPEEENLSLHEFMMIRCCYMTKKMNAKMHYSGQEIPEKIKVLINWLIINIKIYGSSNVTAQQQSELKLKQTFLFINNVLCNKNLNRPLQVYDWHKVFLFFCIALNTKQLIK